MQSTLNLKGLLLDVAQPQIMAILNLTPDSFYSGSRIQQKDTLLFQAEKMIQEGAAILDIGGYSTRPNASEVSLTEEIERTIPAITLIVQYFPDTFISIDTFRSEVAEAAIQVGACMVNDVSGGCDAMFDVVATHQVPYVLTHSRGNPQTMQQLTQYENVVSEVLDFLQQKIYQLRQKQVKDIVIDLGFGFAKNISQNFELLQQLAIFQVLELPILVGISRKSMIWKTLQTTPEQALNGTTALHMAALMNGANLLRVHDVKEAKETIQLFLALQTQK
jgi:dihydropteroate synthase